MGCNCGDNEYNIEIENNGSCEPTTPIYNISLGGVGVDGYSPTVEFINQTDSQFQIRVNDVNGTVISNAVPKLSFLIDNYVTNSTFSTTLEDYVTRDYLTSYYYDAASVDALLQNITNNYLKNDGSNAANGITIKGARFTSLNGGGSRISGNRDSAIQIASGTSYLKRANTQGLFLNNNYTLLTTNGGSGKNILQNITKVYYTTNVNPSNLSPNDEIATIGNIGNGTITITQDGVVKGTFTTNQSGNTTIDLDASGSTYTAGTGIDITNDTISIDTSVVATQTDMTNKLATTGQNAASDFTVNGTEITSNGIYKSGINFGSIYFTQTNSDIYYNLGIDSTRAYLDMPSFTLNAYPYNRLDPDARYTLINTYGDFQINTQSTKFYYGSNRIANNEVAVKGDIPTVNNSTITFTQGGVTKGTITLNQSGDQTIALDAGGGGSITNPIELTGTEVLQDPIPAEYKRLLDIIFDGNVYYKYTGELYGSDDITLTMTPSVTSGQNVCGCYTSNSVSDNFSLYVSANTNGSYFRYGNTLYRPVFGAPQKRTITIGSPRTYGFDTDITGIAEQEFTTSTDFYIGALPNSTSAKFKGTFSGNIQISDRVVFIPVERISDGEIGYYIPSDNLFLENQGTGTPTTSGYDTGVYTSTKETTLTLGVETTTEETYLAPILTVEQEYTAEGTTTTNTFNIATEPWVISQGYTSNVGTVTSVNNVQPDANGNVTIQGGGGAVDSVNGQTGTVVLTANDVGALPDSTDLSNYVTLNSFQTISGNKTFTGNVVMATNLFSCPIIQAGNSDIIIDASQSNSYVTFGNTNRSLHLAGSSARPTYFDSNYNSFDLALLSDIPSNIPSINDTTPSTTTVYSSQKTQDLIDALVARIMTLEANINGGNA